MKYLSYYSNLWVLKNPVILFRIIKGFLRAFVLRKNTLRTVEVYPTFKCQSNCKMCSVKKYMVAENTGNTLSLEEYDSVASQSASLGAIAVSILGGEPLLTDNLTEIVKVFKEHQFFVTMVSNSLLIDESTIENLRNAGLDSVYFSLESLDEQTSDDIRGCKGHYRSVMNAIDTCRQAGLLVGLAGVILPGKLDEYLQLLDFCRKNDLLSSGGEVAPVGAGEGMEIVSDEEHQKVVEILRTYPRHTFDWALSYFLKTRCPAGKEKIGITNLGDVIGCSLLPISFGNVRRESLHTIWNRMGTFSHFRKDWPSCLAATDKGFIQTILKPTCQSETHPIPFADHPAITPSDEPDLFR